MATASEIITQTANRYNVPAWIPLDIANYESGLDPNNLGDYVGSGIFRRPTSFGLFQLHRGGLAPSSKTNTELLDPALNSQIAISHMAPAVAQGEAAGLQGFDLLQFVANTTGWPGSLGVDWTNANRPDYTAGLLRSYNQLGESVYGPPNPSQITQYADATTGPVGTFRALNQHEHIQSYKDWSVGKSTLEKVNPLGYVYDQGMGIGVRILIVLIGLVFLIFAVRAMVVGTVTETLFQGSGAPSNPQVPPTAAAGEEAAAIGV